MHGSVSAFYIGAGLGDIAPVIASDISLVPGDVSLGAGEFSQGSVTRMLEGGGSPTAAKDVASVFHVPTQSHACMRYDGLHVMSPRTFGVMSNSPVDVALVSSICPRVEVGPSTQGPTPLSPPPLDIWEA